jgi:hypothetical protein
MFKRIFILSTAALALAAGSAAADSSTPVKGPFFGTVHAVGTITYKDASQQTWNWDRGKITALDSTSITLTRRDKVQVTFAITSSTLVRNDGASYQLSDLKLGLAATVISQNGNADIIRNIRGDGAPTGADQSAIEGPAAKSVTGTIVATYVDASTQSFDYTRGVITQAGDGKLSVMRPDKQQVDLTYDSSTVVRDCHGQVESTNSLAVGQAGMFISQSGALKLAGCLHDRKTPPAGNGGLGNQRPVAPAAA